MCINNKQFEGVTKVGSRRVVQWGALVMIIFGLFSKFGKLIFPPLSQRACNQIL